MFVEGKSLPVFEPANPIHVYLEIGQKVIFAGVLMWPGWCRLGRDERAALQALCDYGPRCCTWCVLHAAQVEFQPPADPSGFVVIERSTAMPPPILVRPTSLLPTTPVHSPRLMFKTPRPFCGPAGLPLTLCCRMPRGQDPRGRAGGGPRSGSDGQTRAGRGRGLSWPAGLEDQAQRSGRSRHRAGSHPPGNPGRAGRGGAGRNPGARPAGVPSGRRPPSCAV